MDEHDKLIVAIVFGVIGIISIIVIICFIIWLIRRKKLKPIKLEKSFSISHRQQFQPSQKLSSIKSNNNQRKTKRKRFNTNDSVVSLSFNPPHLINQNVKNLDSLRPTDRSWPYGNSVQAASNKDYRSITTSSTVSVYPSSLSSESPSIPKIATSFQSYQKLNTLHFHFLNELNLVLSTKQEQKPTNSLKYSQSCRQINDRLPFDYYRSVTPSTITFASSNNDVLFKYSNTSLMRKAQLAQLRDDTGILY